MRYRWAHGQNICIIVFHDMYTTQTGRSVLTKFLRHICNKYNYEGVKLGNKISGKKWKDAINGWIPMIRDNYQR
ncbi:MAG: hypothetical protein A3D31_01115 [Candidatus Fluviicola riflensis]|nr:MAG: hypothetical protein CHH17_04425 [Candidatus Fluviicola riflensis]OGS76206.1 MAG: hypothetical protein A3D31_01115 [Candidatus Fluviicola riflensis]OGS83250.1 MAG: hypothetical protein A2724_00725 [Fluviicola sp. RIFCSPHIGHO2_01_FULL_43_53]OGS83738.1 MAG: hypothetical protein A3E30_17720 [Fluviicola sp. RIFCSPHIGHO2_12_FULL_43_24]